MLNQVRPVLWKGCGHLSDGLIRYGYTDNYVRAVCDTTSDVVLFNQIEQNCNRCSTATARCRAQEQRTEISPSAVG